MKTIALSLVLLPFVFGCESHQQMTSGTTPKSTTIINAKLSYGFETFGPKGLPPAWEVGETNGRGKLATWGKVPGKKGAGFGVLHTENSGSTFNMALLQGVERKDFVAELWVQARSGREDQGGGLVWRAKDFDNYYICRWNPLEDNYRFYKVVQGRRSMLATSKVHTDPKAWHKLRVEVEGPKVKLYFDGALKMEAEDSSLEKAGRFGLWTKADAATSFDEVKIHWQ